MSTKDRCCTILPYFKVSSGNLGAFKKLCEQFVTMTSNEPKCLYYGFSFDGDQVHCREGYEDAESLLAHLDNVGPLLHEALKIAEITRLEVHGRRRNWRGYANPWPSWSRNSSPWSMGTVGKLQFDRVRTTLPQLLALAFYGAATHPV